MVAPGDPDAASRPRVELTRAQAMDVATLAGLLRETSEHHDQVREDARRASLVGLVRALSERASDGSSPEEAAAAADRYMEEVLAFFPDDAVRVATLSEYAKHTNFCIFHGSKGMIQLKEYEYRKGLVFVTVTFLL